MNCESKNNVFFSFCLFFFVCKEIMPGQSFREFLQTQVQEALPDLKIYHKIEN